MNQMIAFSIDQCTNEKWRSHLTPEHKRLVEEHVKRCSQQRLKPWKQENNEVDKGQLPQWLYPGS